MARSSFCLARAETVAHNADKEQTGLRNQSVIVAGDGQDCPTYMSWIVGVTEFYVINVHTIPIEQPRS